MCCSLSGGAAFVCFRCQVLRNCTLHLIKLEEVCFASVLVLNFLARHKLAIAIQQIVYKQNIAVKPFTDEFGLPSNGIFFDHILSSIIVKQGFQFIENFTMSL